jgi:hypothetical protein
MMVSRQPGALSEMLVASDWTVAIPSALALTEMSRVYWIDGVTVVTVKDIA